MASLEANNTTSQKQDEERFFHVKEKLARMERSAIKATGLLKTQVQDQKKKLGDQERQIKDLAQQVQMEKQLRSKLESELKTEQEIRQELIQEMENLKVSFASANARN